MAVPNIFANVTTSIPLSQLDTNFATAVVLGNTSVYLGNTTTTLGNVTLANANVTTALTIAGASGTSGQVLTSGGANTAPTWTTIAASAATPTALGTVYGKMDNASPYNTSTGYQAGASTTAGSNVFMGYQAGYTNVSGSNITAVGFQAGYSYNGSSTQYTFIGDRAGYSTVSGAGGITAVGAMALYTNTTGSGNIAVGGYDTVSSTQSALKLNTTGSNNTAVGVGALASNTTASNQVAIGYQAGYSATTQGDYTFVGYRAGKNTTTNGNASAFGSNALRDNTTGYQITAIGDGALIANTSGFKNIAIGTNSLAAMVSGSSNTSVGAASGGSCTGGSNTLIGADTGSNLTSGNVNTFVGRNAGQVFTTGSYNTHIGYATSGSGAGQGSEIVITGGPNGATGKGGDTGFITPNGGPMFQGNNAGSWSTVSDRRLKKNIVDNNEGLNKIAQIQVRNFEYRIEEEITDLPKEQVIKKTGIQFGVIAQELQAVLPDCVTEQSTGVLTIDSDNLTWYLINAVKELKVELDALKAKVA